MFSLFALQLISNYLKLHNSDSSWVGIFFGVPQGSILTPILFKIFLSYLFLVIDDIDFVSYPDDNTIYCGGDTIDDVILSLQDSAQKVFQWFSDTLTHQISRTSYFRVFNFSAVKQFIYSLTNNFRALTKLIFSRRSKL